MPSNSVFKWTNIRTFHQTFGLNDSKQQILRIRRQIPEESLPKHQRKEGSPPKESQVDPEQPERARRSLDTLEKDQFLTLAAGGGIKYPEKGTDA